MRRNTPGLVELTHPDAPSLVFSDGPRALLSFPRLPGIETPQRPVTLGEAARLGWRVRRIRFTPRTPRRIAPRAGVRRSRSRRPRSSRSRARSPDPDPAHTGPKQGSERSHARAPGDRRGESSRVSTTRTAPAVSLEGEGHRLPYQGRTQASTDRDAGATGAAYRRALDVLPAACPLCALRLAVGDFAHHRVGGRDGRRCLRVRELVIAGWRRDPAGTWRRGGPA